MRDFPHSAFYRCPRNSHFTGKVFSYTLDCIFSYTLDGIASVRVRDKVRARVRLRVRISLDFSLRCRKIVDHIQSKM